ncbi:MAG: oligosaccharide flippase family protein [Deltaproteobacteria bacterium]|nr:oligosaccharide flippase family protein [Deltaproteobacteria bacterium]
MKELARGIRINILGNFLRFSRAGFLLFAAWAFGVEAFGIYTVVWAATEVLIRFGYLGLDQGLLFELAHFKKQENDAKLYGKIAASLKVCLTLALLEMAGLFFYCRYFVDGPQIRRAFYILIPVVPCYMAATLLLQATQGLKEMKYAALVRSGAEPAALMLFAVIFWVSPVREVGIILAQAASLAVAGLLSLWAFRRFFSLSKLFRAFKTKIDVRSLIFYSIPMQGIELLDTLFYRLDIFFISWFLGTGSPEQRQLLGIYGLAKQIARVITQTKTAFGQIFVPVTSESFLGEEEKTLKKQLRYALEKIVLLNVPFVLILGFFGLDILGWYGKDASILPRAAYFWLLAGQFCFSNAYLLMLFLVTVGEWRWLVPAGAGILLAAFAGGFWVTPVWGATGAAAVTFFTYFCWSSLAVLQTRRHFDE